MPLPPGITPELADILLDLIEAESAVEVSRFRGAQISTAPFTAADVALGAAIFRGAQRLKNGGAACISCHSSASLSGLGGAVLGLVLLDTVWRGRLRGVRRPLTQEQSSRGKA
jgi:cytochrome c peroxidase